MTQAQLTSTVNDDDSSPHIQTQAVKDNMFKKLLLTVLKRLAYQQIINQIQF